MRLNTYGEEIDCQKCAKLKRTAKRVFGENWDRGIYAEAWTGDDEEELKNDVDSLIMNLECWYGSQWGKRNAENTD